MAAADLGNQTRGSSPTYLDERCSPEARSHEQPLTEWETGEGCQGRRDVNVGHPELGLAGIELLAEPRHLLEHRGWLEAFPESFLPTLHLAEHFRSPKRIHVAEPPAEKGR